RMALRPCENSCQRDGGCFWVCLTLFWPVMLVLAGTFAYLGVTFLKSALRGTVLGSAFTHLPRQALIGDNDADPLLDTLAARDITPVIPPKTNRKTPRTGDFALYCERNLVERFFNKLKHFRAIATQYDKLARNFLAGVQLACAIILLN